MAGWAIRLFVIGATAAAIYLAPAVAQTQEISGIVMTNHNGQLTVKTP